MAVGQAPTSVVPVAKILFLSVNIRRPTFLYYTQNVTENEKNPINNSLLFLLGISALLTLTSCNSTTVLLRPGSLTLIGSHAALMIGSVQNRLLHLLTSALYTDAAIIRIRVHLSEKRQHATTSTHG